MAVLESADQVSPRSALRHRPLVASAGRSVVTTAAHPVIQRASRVRPMPADDELVSEWKRGDEEEPEYETGPAYAPSSPGGRTQPIKRRLHIHPLLLLGVGMVVTFLLWQACSAGLNWWNNEMDALHFGYPRTFQIDAVVGHNDAASNPSHFIVTNLHGHIEIIEFSGGDGAHTHIYSGPQLFGNDADTAPVTLKFVDINGDHLPDMLVSYQSSWIVLINDQGSFRPPTPQERVEATQYLSQNGQ